MYPAIIVLRGLGIWGGGKEGGRVVSGSVMVVCRRLVGYYVKSRCGVQVRQFVMTFVTIRVGL